MRYGVNYVPRRGWFHAWHDLDPAEIAEDLDAVVALGADHVRIFPLWPLLQPARTLIRPRAVQDVLTVVDLAGERGLGVVVDGLQGHLSGFDFLPTWVTQWRRRNIFTEPDVVEAQRQLLTTLAEAVSDRPAVIGMTVGNETGQFAGEWHPERYPATPAQMGEWLTGHLVALRSGDPGLQRVTVHSFDDDAWFADSCPVRPDHATALGDVTTVHSWVFGRAAATLGEAHPDLAYFADYLVQLAVAWSPDPNRKVWLQEIGAPQPSAGEPADFLRRSLDAVLDNPALWGVTWWCSHDVSPDLPDFRPLEYTLGLIDTEGVTKPIGEAFAEVGARIREGIEPRPRTRALVIPTGTTRQEMAPGGTLFARWVSERKEGPIGLVMGDRAGDATYLVTAGVTDLVEV